ncbi:MAG: four helix bundle protein [Saprospiraceae bacterium]
MKTKQFFTGEDPLKEKTLILAIRIVNLCKYLKEEKKEYTISGQIIRSGTNSGAMVREAKNAESPKDFIHKLSVGQKETAETQFWLELLYETDFINKSEFDSLHANTVEVMKLIRSSILTKKKNMTLKAISVLVIIGGLTWFIL